MSLNRKQLVQMFVAVVGAVIITQLFYFFVFTGNSQQPPEEVIAKYKELWDYNYPTEPRALTCGHFSSPEAAMKELQFYIELDTCKEDQNRLIGFVEEENLYGFLTCYPMDVNDYFCCAEISTSPSSHYLSWKDRCT